MLQCTKFATQLLHRTKCRIVGREQAVVITVASAVGTNLMETLCLETGCDWRMTQWCSVLRHSAS